MQKKVNIKTIDLRKADKTVVFNYLRAIQDLHLLIPNETMMIKQKWRKEKKLLTRE
jgi:hypothetical protein